MIDHNLCMINNFVNWKIIDCHQVICQLDTHWRPKQVRRFQHFLVMIVPMKQELFHFSTAYTNNLLYFEKFRERLGRYLEIHITVGKTHLQTDEEKKALVI